VPLKISKTVLGVIAAVAVLIIIAVLFLKIPGIAPAQQPPAVTPAGPPVNTSEAEKKLGAG
jgi:hypothetical protein